MNFHMNLQSRRCKKKVEAEPSAIFLPEELIAEVLLFLPVKSITRFKCVSKSYNTLISDRKFIKLHLHRSSQKTYCTLVYADKDYMNGSCSVSFTAIQMLQNPRNSITTVPYLRRHIKDCCSIVGSCNGLLCLSHCRYDEWWFRFWNPATHKLSKKLGSFRENFGLFFSHSFSCNFTLGYDESKDTFKLVHFIPRTTNVRILSLTDNVWRNIQNSPVAYHNYKTNVVHLRGSVNWLPFGNKTCYDYYHKDIAIEEFVIISLDLDNETHTKLSTPQGFNEVPFVVPNLSVLKDCLCFSHDFKKTHFVIWQMKLFGVEESWIQLLKVSYHDFQEDYRFNDCSDIHWLPVCLSEKNDTLLLTNNIKHQAILYNWRDNRTEWTQSINELQGLTRADYVESLVWYC